MIPSQGSPAGFVDTVGRNTMKQPWRHFVICRVQGDHLDLDRDRLGSYEQISEKEVVWCCFRRCNSAAAASLKESRDGVYAFVAARCVWCCTLVVEEVALKVGVVSSCCGPLAELMEQVLGSSQAGHRDLAVMASLSHRCVRRDFP